MKIQTYTPEFEDSWLRCKLLSYFYTSFYADVETSKTTFDGRPTIELIAVENGIVVGFLDMVLDTEELKTSFLGDGLGAFLKTLAVHPDYQSQGIGRKLYETALNELETTPIEFIELYTRGDEPANHFYKKLGFELLLETYDVFGMEKSKRKPITLTGIKNKKLQAIFEDGETCDYIMVDSVFEVYDRKALDKIDYERYYPSRGYYKKIK